jgi:hypothetical protein
MCFRLQMVNSITSISNAQQAPLYALLYSPCFIDGKNNQLLGVQYKKVRKCLEAEHISAH